MAKRADIASAGPAHPDKKNCGNLEHLLGRVAHGDEAAFAAVYDQAAGPVYGLACAMTGDAEWSQEVAAAALTEVWRAAPQYDPAQAGALAWIMTVARQHVVAHLRAARTRRARQNRAWPARHRNGHPAGDARSVIGSGCAPEQQAVLLALYGGYAQGEISDRLGLTPQVVAELIRDGLVQMGRGELAL